MLEVDAWPHSRQIWWLLFDDIPSPAFPERILTSEMWKWQRNESHSQNRFNVFHRSSGPVDFDEVRWNSKPKTERIKLEHIFMDHMTQGGPELFAIASHLRLLWRFRRAIVIWKITT
jgi:hypothetical protein